MLEKQYEYQNRPVETKKSRDFDETPKNQAANKFKHIPCLLIQKRFRTATKKRESSVVNLLRNHMADLAKTY